MKRGALSIVAPWFLRIVVVLGVLAVVVFEPLPTSSEQSTDDAARITRYDSNMILSGDGDLFVDETVQVDLPPGKRGIFRIFDTADPRRDGVDHPVVVESVERDGLTEPYTEVSGARGTKSIRIGDEDVFLDSGAHTYRIRSSTTDVLEPGTRDDETLWWWDVVGSGWQIPMAEVAITVDLPAVPIRAECVMAENTPCTASVEGTSLQVRTGPLAPFTPVTVRVAFPADAVATPIAPEEEGPNTVTIVVSILLALLAAGGALWLWRSTRERDPGFPVLFEPPFLVPPALAVRVLTERHSDSDLQATLFDLAERGFLRLQGDESTWYIEVIRDLEPTQLHPVEERLVAGLGLSSVGDTFIVSGTESSGRRVKTARDALRSQVSASATEYLRPSGAGYAGIGIGWLALAATVAMVAIYFFGQNGWVSWLLLAPCAAYALVALGMMFDQGVLTTRTRTGRDLWSRTGGFARFLTTDSAESRFEAAEHLDWYPRYLAWAVAFGSADEWAERYQAQGVSVPEVPWLIWGGVGHGFSSSSMNQSFNSAIASASTAYAASQASSGGGGFSGGSGGGGGGGGSW